MHLNKITRSDHVKPQKMVQVSMFCSTHTQFKKLNKKKKYNLLMCDSLVRQKSKEMWLLSCERQLHSRIEPKGRQYTHIFYISDRCRSIISAEV